MRNSALRSCGLYQTRDSTVIGRAPLPRRRLRLILRRGRLQHAQRVPHHGRRGIRVVAVDDHLHRHALAGEEIPLESRRNHQRRAHLAAVDQLFVLAAARHVGGELEVAGLDERVHQLAARLRAIVVVDGELDVLHVEVERIAVQQQEERRHEQQHHQRTAIARDLAELLAADGERLTHARPHRETRLRATASRDRCRRCRARARSACRVSASRSTSGVLSTACTAVPNTVVFSTSGMSSSARITSTGRLEWISRIGRLAKISFSSRDVPIAASLPALMIAMRWQCSASSR